MDKLKILFTVCARKGSKRLPNKNIKDFYGFPLITWTINQIVDFRNKYVRKYDIDICICTNIDIELFSQYICGEFYFLKRPEYLNDDDIPKLDVIRYIYNDLQSHNYDFVIDLDVTNPCRTREDIENCIELFKDNICSTLFSVVEASKTLYFNQIEKINDYIESKVDNVHDREYYQIKTYNLNASIYIYSIEFLKGIRNTPICNNSIIYLMPEWTAFDIDTQIDWDIAKLMFGKHILKYKHILK